MQRVIPTLCAAAAVSLMLVAPALALPKATWVSPAGNDAGTCPITAPCKTFQYAANNTRAGGAINVLKSGEFGPVNIAQSLSIIAVGAEGAIRSVAGGAAITINAAGAEVFLRGIKVDLSGTPHNAIQYSAGAALHVRDCTFTGGHAAIKFEPSAGINQLHVSNTKITNVDAYGITVAPTGTAVAKVVIDRTIVSHSGYMGLALSSAGGSLSATVRESVVSGALSFGVVSSHFGGPAEVMLDRVSVANNGSFGITSEDATIRVGNSVVSGNLNGLQNPGGTDVIASYGNNKIVGNTNSDGTPTSTIPMK